MGKNIQGTVKRGGLTRMNINNSMKLIERFNFFNTAMFFECGDGWFDIIWSLCEEIENNLIQQKEKDPKQTTINILKDKNNFFKVVQVKAKFGTLRFYIEGSANVEEIHRFINEAENKSAITCEKCGKPGKLMAKGKGGWVTALCRICAKTVGYTDEL
jgi:ribosomal protein S14